MEIIQLKAPNQEQKLAIEHEGGVLLNAGAGSGKTFVLVEHAIFLTQSFFQRNSFLNQDSYEVSLKSYFSKIVYMTFTKKATGELSVRLKNRFEVEISQAHKDKSCLKLWQAEMAFRSLEFLNVTTIHGFCLRLLQQGYFFDANFKQDIIKEIEFKDKIEFLVEKWFLLEKNDVNEHIKEVLLLNKNFLCSAFVNIFMSPEIRLLWKKLDVKKMDLVNDKNLMKKFFSLIGIQDIQELNPSFEDFKQKKKPKWSIWGKSFLKSIKEIDLNSYMGISNLKQVFDVSGKIPPTSQSQVPSSIYDFYQKVKKLKKFVKDYGDDFIVYSENKSKYFLLWADAVKNLYCFIEENYHTIPGLTFSDLEYFVFTGLENDSSRTKIQQQYQYFVVDEFQDTSEIQFNILDRIAKKDYTNLFCVGDIKQAIYGFRGGELNVFRSYSKKANKNLSLNYNYRSCREIVRFNNTVFENVFFEKNNQDEIFFRPQKCPECVVSGSINKYGLEVLADEEKNLTGGELDWVESKEIVNFIEKKWKDESLNICILYKQLTPLKFLFPLIMQKNLPFTCQIKVKLEEDPLLCLYFNLLTPFVNENFIEAKSECIQLGKIIIEILKGNVCEKIDSKFENFYKNVKIFGIWEAFKKLLFDLGVHNSNYENNFELIKSFCLIGDDNFLNILKNINLFDRNYSVEIRSGLEFEKIRIMTVHASKGLEFDHVILAGIHTNGRTRSEMPLFGERPLSFKWKKETGTNIFYKSPEYIYEFLINKKKDTKESMRLLYVACTRAKKQLSWFDIKLNAVPQCVKNSWIERIRCWEEEKDLSGLINLKKIKIEKDWKSENIDRVGHSLPLFRRDSLGFYLRPKISQERMIFLPKLSVTKMLPLFECPRKFYFKNILEVSELPELRSNQKKNQKHAVLKKDNEFSYGERGESIHRAISYSLKNNFEKLNFSEEKDNEVINWTLNQLMPYTDDYQFISEKEIRFPFFNFMISGKPDLALLNNNTKKIFEIWDFKTGIISPIKIASYWFQLMSYAYGFYQLSKIDFDKKIKLVLCFVDKQNIQTKEFSFPEISDSLYKEWKKIDSLNEKNENFCPTCSYGNLCHPN